MRTVAATRADLARPSRKCDRCGRPIPATASTRRPCLACPPISRRTADRVFR